MAKTLLIQILKKTLFWPKMREICQKSPFLQTFSLFYISCFFFSHKIIAIPNIFVKIAGTADCRAGKMDFLQYLECSQYFIDEFLLYSFTRSFIRLPVRSFVFHYLFHLCLCFLSLSNFHHQVGPISIQLVLAELTSLFPKIRVLPCKVLVKSQPASNFC